MRAKQLTMVLLLQVMDPVYMREGENVTLSLYTHYQLDLQVIIVFNF